MYFLTELADSSNYSMLMAFMDLIPVGLFFVAGIILINDLYNKFVKGAYALLTTGIIMVFLAGLLKALHKMLVAGAVFDSNWLFYQFFPMQSFGFMFYGVALLLGILYAGKKINSVNSFVLLSALLVILTPVEKSTSSMPYVVLQIVGDTMGLVLLSIYGAKMKKIVPIILFVVSFICMLGMGYASTRLSRVDASEIAKWNWIAESVNIIGQGALLGGVIILHKNGLADINAFHLNKN